MTKQLPLSAVDYVKKHFGDAFFTSVRAERNIKGRPFYEVEVVHEDVFYHLTFDEHGRILQSTEEPLQEIPDEGEEYGWDD